MLYPFVMKPVFKNYLWGGRNLQKFGKDLPDGIIAEAWEVSTHPDGPSMISNGAFAGSSLKDLIELFPEDILGSKIYNRYQKEFPLLFKLIDANEPLSLQVHPDDAYARAHEQQAFGKYEAWYILDAKPGASIVYGLIPGTDRESFKRALYENYVADYLNTIQVKPGDIIDVRPGLVHAIGRGVVVAEIQQNSNLTYRVYDYDRLDAKGGRRELHIQKALDVIDFGTEPGSEPLGSIKGWNTKPFTNAGIVHNDYFTLEPLYIKGKLKEKATGEKFYILFVCEGAATIRYGKGAMRVPMGQTVLIPASLGPYSITGPCRILKMFATNSIERNVSAHRPGK